MEALLNSLAVPGSLLVFGSGLSWFIAAQFTNVRKMFQEEINRTQEAIIRKLEYHEHHDDTRFNAITNDLWQIRIANATRDSVNAEDRKVLNTKVDRAQTPG